MAGLKKPISQAGPDVQKIARQLEKGLSTSKLQTVTKAAERAKVVHNHEIAKVAGTDMRLSGVNRAKGRKGNVRVGTKYKVRNKGYAMAEGFVAAVGPMQLIERDTNGHVISSAWAVGKNRRGFTGPILPGNFATGMARGKLGPALPNTKAVIKIPGIGYRRYARHPGTKGQEPWAKGYRRAKPLITKTIRGRTHKVIKDNKGL